MFDVIILLLHSCSSSQLVLAIILEPSLFQLQLQITQSQNLVCLQAICLDDTMLCDFKLCLFYHTITTELIRYFDRTMYRFVFVRYSNVLLFKNSGLYLDMLY